MDKIGLSYEQIDSILFEAIAPEKIDDGEKLRDVIAKSIVENNKKVLDDIKAFLEAK